MVSRKPSNQSATSAARQSKQTSTPETNSTNNRLRHQVQKLKDSHQSQEKGHVRGRDTKHAKTNATRNHCSGSQASDYHIFERLVSPIALGLVVVVSGATRLYNIHQPAHVCWDETHFGKMASWYLNRTFFFDVHPPLGKMLIALSGHLTGYDGRFPFDKPGDEYESADQYVGMRVFCALLGLIIPVFIYISTKSMTKSVNSALMAASLILFDNGTITLTRYILLDPPLLFFIAASILGLSKLSFSRGPKSGSPPFTLGWWFWLVWTGISIASAFSVKFVGLFIVALVGLRTAYDLWIILGDVTKPIGYVIKHLLSRVLCLIILPILVYIAFFWLHLHQLDHSGNGDGFYSSSFQSQLIGNTLHNSSWPAHLAYGAVITLKNSRIGGAYLHSHWHLYPEGVGAKQQQVTTYSHKDSNNKWIIKRGLAEEHTDSRGDFFVRDGDLVRLTHVMTSRNLHSHYENAPLTKRHYQVSCYGENGVGDANDIWQIQKISHKGPGGDQDDRIYTVKTRFRLVHYLTKCALHSHNKQLPKWAYEQMEVTCNPKLHDKNSLWNIEDNYYPSLPNVTFQMFAPSFLERFLEAHAVMLQGNAGLKPKEGEVTSRPWQWPLNYKGQFFSSSPGHKIYLLGNPVIWWANIAALPVSISLIAILAVIQKVRSGVGKTADDREPSGIIGIESTYLETSIWLTLGWSLHYIPFYFMGRVLYFHHYFPAFIFSCMQTAVTIDYVSHIAFKRINSSITSVTWHQIELTCAVLSVVIYTFTKFVPITYGNKVDLSRDDANSTSESVLSEQKLSSLKWLDSWEF